jgi:hypothetical protein
VCTAAGEADALDVCTAAGEADALDVCTASGETDALNVCTAAGDAGLLGVEGEKLIFTLNVCTAAGDAGLLGVEGEKLIFTWLCTPLVGTIRLELVMLENTDMFCLFCKKNHSIETDFIRFRCDVKS